MAAKYLDPPAFIGPKRTYTMYRSDLMMWSRITPIKEESQAEVVVYNLEGHSSGIKEKIMTKIGETLVNNKEGIKVLVEYLDSVYKEADKCDNTGPKKNAKTEAACVAAEVGNKRLDDCIFFVSCEHKNRRGKGSVGGKVRIRRYRIGSLDRRFVVREHGDTSTMWR